MALRSKLIFLGCAASLWASLAFGQASPMAPSDPGSIRRPAPADVVKAVGVDQKLGDQIPLDLVFYDEAGNQVRLGDYFGKRPVVLAPVYYQCPMLCTMTLNGLTTSFKPLSLNIGQDYDVVTVSFDPTEKPPLAAAKKATYLKQYNRPGAEAGWHFLTGDEESIRKLMSAIGFRYTYDAKTKQYAHASSIMVLTPQGRLSRYFYGLEYSTRDIRLGLVEASENKIGTLSDALILLCYHYDAATGKYSLAVMKSLRVAGVLTVVGIAGFVAFMIRRDHRMRGPAGTKDLLAGDETTAPAGTDKASTLN